jgi:hypothetical protein
MSRRTVGFRCALAGLGAVLVLVISPAHAAAAGYKVANCTADPGSYSTEAFGRYLTRGMIVSERCAPRTGERTRGLGIGSVSRRGGVERGAVAQLTIDAPAGTAFNTYAWTGRMERVDCRYAMQIFAVIPNAKPKLLQSKRANHKCPRKGRAQAASINRKDEPFHVEGATQIVQRVVCVGRGGDGCSGGSGNRMWTETAIAEVEDVQAPTAVIRMDTPLTSEQWVNGFQPLNYDASDNVGVRSARVLAGAAAAGNDERPCRFATPGQTFVVQVPCANGPGTVSVDTGGIPEGTQPLVLRVEDPAGNPGDAEAVQVHIDRTPPGRVDVGVEGGRSGAAATTSPSGGQTP